MNCWPKLGFEVASFDMNFAFTLAHMLTGLSLQDELAENVVASPPYVFDEMDMDNMPDYDVYNYWGDIEYGSDSYWDTAIRQLRDEKQAKTGDKRKRVPETAEAKSNKRRKSEGAQQTPTPDDSDNEMPNVVFKSFEERSKLHDKRPTMTGYHSSFALLGDWKERFNDVDGFVFGTKEMPKDMQTAAEARDEDAPPKKTAKQQSLPSPPEGDEEWEDDDEAMDDSPLAALDPEMLKAILKEKMSAAGMEGMDEAAFMATISKMLAGEGDADEAAGELANGLLGQANDGGESALSGWLSQQGVDLQQDDDASSVTTAELPGPAKEGESHASPPDSVVGVHSDPKAHVHHPAHPEAVLEPVTSGEVQDHNPRRRSSLRKAIGVVIPSSPSASASAKKRLAAFDADDKGRKRKKVSFDVPQGLEETTLVAEPLDEVRSTAADESITSNNPLVPSDEGETGLPTRGKGADSSEKPKALRKTRESKVIGAEPETSEEKLKGVSKTAPKTRNAKAKPGDVDKSATASDDTVEKPTKKRKAQPDDAEAKEATPAKRRQTRGFAAPTASTRSKAEPAKRATRSKK